jgi:membrane-associated phospholipid phosphatase
VPFAIDLIAAAIAGLLALLATRWYLESPLPRDPAQEAAEMLGEAARHRWRLRGLVASRLDRSLATGLLLTAALAVTLVGGVVLAVLAFLTRRWAAVQHLDNAVATWSLDHRNPASTSALKAVTQLGNVRLVIALGLVLAVADLILARGRWAPLFLAVAVGGTEAVSIGVKELVDRARPTIFPDTVTLGPSFPSGHSAMAATFYAATALVIGRWIRGRPLARQLLPSAAAAIAVAVAASRVLLDVHWLSDVVGGLALGWAWFALVSVVFGGRLLRPIAAAVASGDLSAASTRANIRAPDPQNEVAEGAGPRRIA